MSPELNLYILFWVCIIGLCMGSFFNVVILRSISNESIVFPPSKCPKCGNKLKPWHNIPVLSYIFLKGKCAFCNEKISIQYPIVELITMLLFAVSYLQFGINIKTAFVVIICSAFIIMTGTDIKEKIVDCNIPIGLVVLGLIYNHFVTNNIIGALLGLAAGVLIIESIARIGQLFFSARTFGEADTYVAGALGTCLGLKGLLLTLGYSLAASMLFIIPIFLYKQYKQNKKLTCILFILFTCAALAFKTLTQDYITLSILVALGTTLAIIILKDIKKQDDFTYLPLVPAFTLGTLYYLFF